MKKKVLILMIGFLLIGVNVYAQGDLIVNGYIGLSTTTSTAGIIKQGTDRLLHTYTPPGETENLFVGSNSGNFTLTTSEGNVGLGANTLQSLTSGKWNMAMGSNALANNQGGFDNMAIGSGSLYSLQSGTYNVAVGTDALYFLSSGDGSIAIGGEALRKVYSAGNIGIGYQAGQNLKSSFGNTIIGYQAAKPAVQPTTGNINNNVMIGYQTGYNVTDNSSGNVFIGYEAGYNETGSDKLYIANSSADPPLIYGDFFSGDVGIGTTTPAEKLDVEGNVEAWGFITGDITFQKDGKKLWRMFEDEDGLYIENVKTGKVYRFVLQEVEKK